MLSTEETIDGYVRLFQGNDSHYGTEEGGCVEARHDWPQIADWHLQGRIEPVGVYPMMMGSAVKWGCVDFDEGYEDSLKHALNLRLVLSQFGITGFIERSRSKGYHVWIFCQQVADARLVRRALLAACQVVQAPTKEINPKQEALSPGHLGNYVRLPYPGALVSDELPPTRVFLDERAINMPPRAMVEWALDTEAAGSRLHQLASFYAPPRNHLLVPKRDFSNVEGNAYYRMSGLARTIYEEGPRYNEDRSTRLWKLASTLRDNANHSVDEVITLVREADRRWGKFHTRPTGDSEITRLVHKVYGMT